MTGPLSESNPRSEEWFGVHPGRVRNFDHTKLKIWDKVLLVLFCDTYAAEHVYITISRVLVVISARPSDGFSLRGTEKSVDRVSFLILSVYSLVVRFSKCQKRVLLKKPKIVDTYNPI